MRTASVVRSDEGGRSLDEGSTVKQRYVLGARIGWDAGGGVYEALDTSLSDASGHEHYVALQFLPRYVNADSPRLEAFKSQFLRVRALAHPNIARVFDLDADEHGAFVTHELLEGASLTAILDESSSEPVSKAEALAIVRGVGDALAHAHASGVAHGDLGPDSVVVSVDYEVKVKGFLRVREAASLPGLVAGAPAQNTRADVRALAQLAYALLAGEWPASAGQPVKPQRPRGLSGRQWKTLARALAGRDAAPADVRALLEGLEITGSETLAAIVAEPRRGPRVRKPFWLAACAALAAAGLYHGQEELAGAAARLEARLALGAADASRDAPNVTDAPRARPADALELVDARRAALRRPDPAPVPVESAARDGLAALPALPDVELGAPAREDDAVAPVSVPPGPAVGEGGTVSPAEAVDSRSSGPAPGTETPASPSFAFVASRTTVSESAGLARLAVRRAGDVSDPATIAWWTVPGSARAGEDYADLGRVEETFAAGARELVLYVPITSDSVPEADETFEVRFVDSLAESDLAASTRSATVTIVDDD